MSRISRFDDGRKFAQYATCDGGAHQAAVPVDATEREKAWFATWVHGHDRVGKYDRARGNAMEPCPGTVTIHTNAVPV
jgi:hypothetical protein